MPQLRNGSQYSSSNTGEGVGPARSGTQERNGDFPTPSPAPALAIVGAGPQTLESASPRRDLPSEEDEDSILDEPAPMDIAARENKSLLALRQDYKKTKSNLDRANSHLDFIQDCISREKVPRGLQVNVKCSALMADATGVTERFKKTKTTAEKEYSNSLRGHYIAVRSLLHDRVKELERQMERELTRASDEERELHRTMMEKTRTNLQRQKEQLAERKKKKLEGYRQPQGRQQREGAQQEGGARRRQGQGGATRQRSQAHPRQQPRTYGERVRGHQGAHQTTPPTRQAPQQTGQPPQGSQAQTSQADMATVVALLQQLVQVHGNPLPNPPPLFPPQPCAVGQQQPQLHVPAVRVPVRQPPSLPSQYQQDFR